MQEDKRFLVNDNEECINQLAVYVYVRQKMRCNGGRQTTPVEGRKNQRKAIRPAKSTYGNLLRQNICTQNPVGPDPKCDSGSKQRLPVIP